MNKSFNLILIIFILISHETSAQRKIEGSYTFLSPTDDLSTTITFSKTGIFEYNESGHFGTEDYGNGTYLVDRKKLILDFNLTKPLRQSFYESKLWINDKEKVQLKVLVSDLEGNPVPGANVVILADRKGVIVNESGSGKLVLKKENRTAELTISNIGYDEIRITFNQKNNYEFIVNLRKWENGSNSRPILNQVDTLKILRKRV